MNDDIPPPPIASPKGSVGSESPLKPLTEISPIVPIHLCARSAFCSFLADLSHPSNLLITYALTGALSLMPSPLRTFYQPLSLAQWVFLSFGLHLLMTSISTFAALVFFPSSEIEIRQKGVCIRHLKWQKMLPWRRIICVFHFNGDTWLVYLSGSSLIPRESFTSPALSQKFADYARQLSHTNGAAWKTTFGPANSNQK